jgi:hypothetical protein
MLPRNSAMDFEEQSLVPNAVKALFCVQTAYEERGFLVGKAAFHIIE